MRKFVGIEAIDGIDRLPRIGKIALGIKVNARVELLEDWGGRKAGEVVLLGGDVQALEQQGVLRIIKAGRPHPKEVDYFVFRPPSEDEAGAALPQEIHERLLEHYGPEPRALDICLPDEDEGVFFPFAYKMYGQSAGLKCKGDGVNAERVATMEPFNVEKDSGEADQFRELPCPGPECPYYQDKSCRHIGHLMVMLPDVTVAGVFQIDTSSFHSRVGILNDLRLIRSLFGRVSNLVTKNPVGDPPRRRTVLMLTREVKQTRGGGSTRNHWPMRIRIRDAANVNLQMLDQMRLPPSASLRLAPPDERPLDLIPAVLHGAPAGGEAAKCLECKSELVVATKHGLYCTACSCLALEDRTSAVCEGCETMEFSLAEDGTVFCRSCAQLYGVVEATAETLPDKPKGKSADVEIVDDPFTAETKPPLDSTIRGGMLDTGGGPTGLGHAPHPPDEPLVDTNGVGEEAAAEAAGETPDEPQGTWDF